MTNWAADLAVSPFTNELLVRFGECDLPLDFCRNFFTAASAMMFSSSGSYSEPWEFSLLTRSARHSLFL